MKKILFLISMLCSMTAAWAGEGDGSKDKPFTGEWTASELTAMLKPGDRIAYNCQITDGHAINVYDAKLNNQRIGQYENWTPGDAIGESPVSIYEQYCKYNTLEERKQQVFIVTEAHSNQLVSSQVYITGYFSGRYSGGDGSPNDPYTDYWNANDLLSKLKEGDHLAYNCSIDGDSGNIFVYDDKLDNANVYKNLQWNVGYPIGSDEPLPQYYQNYYSFNSPEDRLNHTFIVTKAESIDGTTINITGHYSGSYGGGDGSKEHPFTGVWTASEIGPKLEPGMYIAFDCVIKDVNITVFDSKLWQTVAQQWPAWSPGNLIENAKDGLYKHYCEDNTPEDRRRHSFILTEVSPSAKTSSEFTITGYFSGFYRNTPDADGFYHVSTAVQMKNVLNGNDHAKVMLTQDIYMSDLGLGESGRHTLCSTFYGTLDGDGHTIWAARPEVQHDGGGHYHRQYLFTYCDGATIKNVTFKDFRVQSEDHHNQAIITSQAKNKCVFENITFDHVSTYVGGDHNNTGAVVGYATTNCTFKNITVKNSDFTAHNDQAGGVVGHAMNCTFENIKVEKCEATADNDKAGGIAGRSDNCTFNNVDTSGGEIEAKDDYAGGVCGYAEGSKFISCLNSAKVLGDDYVGGILGYCTGTDIIGCRNSGTISHREFYELLPGYEGLGGIVGYAESGSIEQCSNYGEYPSKDDPCGGIVGYAKNMTINNCLCTVAPTPYLTASNTIAYGGIVGYCESCKVTNTLSTEYYVFGGVGNCKDMKSGSGNNFWLNENNHQYEVELTSYEEKAYGLTYGHLTNILNKSKENIAAGIMPWEQELGKDIPRIGDRGLYHTRHIKNPYGTVCFPFPVKSNDKISYYVFTKQVTEGDEIKLKFEYFTDVVPAGIPVLFYAPEVNDKPSDESLVEVCFNNAGSDFDDKPYSYPNNTEWVLEGTYVTKHFYGTDAEKIYYLSDNQFHNAKETIVYPYHAYIVGPSINELGAKNITFSLEDEDGSVTALRYDIENVNPMHNAEFIMHNYYNLNGQRVNANHKGIVIKNGKKTLSPALSR